MPTAIVRGEQLTWTATVDGPAWVSFQSDKLEIDYYGPTVDNISVVKLSAPVPEVGTSALLLAGLAALGLLARRRA